MASITVLLEPPDERGDINEIGAAGPRGAARLSRTPGRASLSQRAGRTRYLRSDPRHAARPGHAQAGADIAKEAEQRDDATPAIADVKANLNLNNPGAAGGHRPAAGLRPRRAGLRCRRRRAPADVAAKTRFRPSRRAPSSTP